jgi:hypothetical protein
MSTYTCNLSFLADSLQDTCYECYRGTSSELENVIEAKGFVMIHEFVGVKTFVYQSPPTDDKDDCCVAMILLHGPIHLALDSRPPWDDFKFGQEQYQQHSDTAVSFHWLHTTSLTFRGVNQNGFETPKEMVGTILSAFALRMFELTRLHLGDSRVATWFGKTLLLGKNSGSSLEYKCLNRYCRDNKDPATWGSKSLLDRIINRISYSNTATEDSILAESIYKMLRSLYTTKKLEDRNKIDARLNDLREKYFVQGSSLFDAVVDKHDEVWEQISRRKEDDESKKAAAREAAKKEAARKAARKTSKKKESYLGNMGVS